ncbi:CRISPR-associated helicase/endonuclease Cas3 [Desulfolucanica intricata]|uniref:CRISPR-associated helicase/endonuclease Cas3 n=1 Tax=Desulfolucanica intricata TaxID=1285191 RepID=UPI00082DEC4A|nr:CRISPR-associated helicase/endonuclease Cas3 [Desulfolucanica intricata]
MISFYAKPDQTYREHIEDVYSAWQETVASKKQLIERMSRQYGFSVNRFLKGSLLTVVLHDIGKMSNTFQAMMKALRDNKKFNYKNNYRHEILSFVLTVMASLELSKKDGVLTQIPVEALAVAGHHRPLNTDLTSFERESRSPVPALDPYGLRVALVLAEEIFAREGWNFPTIDEKAVQENSYKRLAQLVDPYNNLIGKLLDRDGYEKARDLYVLVKGILHYADWHGSGKAKVNYFIEKPPERLEEELAKRCQEKKISFTGLRPFQKSMGQCSGHLLAVAPTGSGKTEGSLLWALKNIQEMDGAKIIYLLPTMNTANQIWERLVKMFGIENVGLTHSTANLFLAEESEEESWADRRDLLFHQSFIKPVTVATVDQWLTCGFNAGRWVLKEINASNAVIILDEVHSYDGWTLGLIISAIRHFTARGSRFLLMSATMPQGLVKLFENVLSDIKVIKEENLLSASRSVYKVVDAPIEEAEKTIYEAVSAGRKVLVVVNTVEKCQQLAEHFAGLNPVCYHSRFILKHRKEIEEGLDQSRFVIATQVIEVSLDIDFDWLFTECAPPDAIAQRAGRVNRYRDRDRDSRVLIYQPSNQSGKIYNPLDNPQLLKRSYKEFQNRQGLLCERDLIEIIEKVYTGYRIDKTEPFQVAIDIYRQARKRRMAIFDSRLDEDEQEVTRQSEYDTVSVIPYCFYEEVINLSPWERKWYEVKVPLWYFIKNKKALNSGLCFCDLEYVRQIGALLKPAKSKVALW